MRPTERQVPVRDKVLIDSTNWKIELFPELSHEEISQVMVKGSENIGEVRAKRFMRELFMLNERGRL